MTMNSYIPARTTTAAKHISRLLIALIFVAFTTPVWAADVIGLSLPLKGRFAPVASRLEFGAYMALEDLKKAGHDIELITHDDGCDPSRASEITQKLRREGARLILGSICFDMAKALAAAAVKELPGTPVITLNDRNRLFARAREFDGLDLFSLSNPPDAEARAVVEKILSSWASTPFAIVDDGSVYGRSLADEIRLLGEEAGLRAVVTANFRPLQSNQRALLRRLARSGVKALFLAAGPEDVATVARDLARLDFDWELATGEPSQLLAFAEGADAVPEGLLMVGEMDPETQQAQSLRSVLKAKNQEPETSLLMGYAMMQIAASAVSENQVRLLGRTFQTVIGDVHFGQDGRATPLPFALYRWSGSRFLRADGNK